jgi:exopolyphosphatase/guanosine-5'-triphosphate,3'-diphosphate pyrophosphatase
MQRTVGIIDLGSNTSRLIVVAYVPGTTFRLIDQVRERVRLSEGMGAENVLRPEPIQRTIHLLKVFRTLAEANGIDTIIAVGTSAVRDARNQAEFLARVNAEAGVSLRVLSGDEEARYGFLGAANSVALRDGLVVDIGGGSMELTRVQDRHMAQSVTLPAGAVRLTEAFLRADPPRPAEVRTLTRYVEYMLADLHWMAAGRADVLVGMGGTIRALAKIDQRGRGYPFARVHGYVLTLRAVEDIVRDLQRLPLSKRKKLSGLNSDRADVILGGAIALAQVMARAGCAELVVCGQGLREGLFYEHFLRGAGEAIVPDVRAFGVANLSFQYDVNWPHARHVEKLATALFDQLRSLHRYGAFERAILSYAALLHDVGVAIDFYDHHEHSANMIQNADLPGFTHREIALMAQLARNHRRGNPRPHPFAGLLTREDDERILKLSALLRLAEYLERSRSQVVQSIKCRVQGRTVQLTCNVCVDASTEVWSTERSADLFVRAFKRNLVIRTRAVRPAAPAAPSESGRGALWDRMEELIALAN